MATPVADPTLTEQEQQEQPAAAAEPTTSTSTSTGEDAPPAGSDSKDENVMPASSIEAANQALTSALEAANISKDDGADVLAPGQEDGGVQTVFHNATTFNVKVRLETLALGRC